MLYFPLSNSTNIFFVACARQTVVLDLPDAVRLDLVAVVSLFPVLDPCCLVLEGITVSEMDTCLVAGYVADPQPTP